LEFQGEYSGALGFTWMKFKKFFLCQSQFIKQLLERFGMKNCKTSDTPMDVGAYKIMEAADDKVLDDAGVKSYQELIGSLLCLSVIPRPDISCAVGILSRFMKAPAPTYLNMAKRVLRYLAGTIDVGTQFGGDLKLTCATDSDWANDTVNRKSTSGFVIKLGDSVIDWSSRQQRSVSLSSTEAESIAMTSGLQDAMWIGSILEELKVRRAQEFVLYCDNQSAIKLGHNPVQHGRTKHIDVRYHFIREAIESGRVVLKYVSTVEMPADMLTKPLGRIVYERQKLLNGILSLSRFKGGIGSGKDCSRITKRVRFSQGEESRQRMKNKLPSMEGSSHSPFYRQSRPP
jgi:hypothetical protein